MTTIKDKPVLPAFLRRKEAAEYLRSRYGFGSNGTLAKLASMGGGPTFHSGQRAALYKPEDLDEWALAQISKPKKSTSDAGENF